MARYTGPKDRLSRREGFDLFGKGLKFTRLNQPPGVHGPKGSRTLSEYGKQLREKQKARRLYGVMEKQFRGYVEEALKSKSNTGERLLSLLEMRLDNVIFRLSFASSRPAARQLVSHKHVLVNGKKVNISSYRVKVGEVITLDSQAVNIPSVKSVLDEKGRKVPDWLERKALAGKIIKEPQVEDVFEPISMQDIVEYYSR